MRQKSLNQHTIVCNNLSFALSKKAFYNFIPCKQLHAIVSHLINFFTKRFDSSPLSFVLEKNFALEFHLDEGVKNNCLFRAKGIFCYF